VGLARPRPANEVVTKLGREPGREPEGAGASHGDGGSGEAWNLGIAATALGDWATARRAWTAFGVTLPAGPADQPIDGDFGITPIRLNPDPRFAEPEFTIGGVRYRTEVVWATACARRGPHRERPASRVGASSRGRRAARRRPGRAPTPRRLGAVGLQRDRPPRTRSPCHAHDRHRRRGAGRDPRTRADVLRARLRGRIMDGRRPDPVQGLQRRNSRRHSRAPGRTHCTAPHRARRWHSGSRHQRSRRRSSSIPGSCLADSNEALSSWRVSRSRRVGSRSGARSGRSRSACRWGRRGPASRPRV
jgi:hypothetical protein